LRRDRRVRKALYSPSSSISAYSRDGRHLLRRAVGDSSVNSTSLVLTNSETARTEVKLYTAHPNPINLDNSRLETKIKRSVSLNILERRSRRESRRSDGGHCARRLIDSGPATLMTYSEEAATMTI